jgi:amidase
VNATDLAFAGLARQAELIRSKEVSPTELLDVCLERIGRLDPELNAFRIVFAERARAEASQAESRLKGGDDRPLLGVPVAVKDNLDVAGEVTAHGSNAYGGPAAQDGEIVRRLRAAGAIPIGKTNMSELAVFPFTETAAWGMTRNAWDRSRSAGGSSGGSGVAVAAGLVGAATASDGGGSIRIPASVSGLFGLKPQRGRISLKPDAEHWHGLSSAGTVTRTVLDTALYLDVVAGPAPGDAHVPPAPDTSFVEAARTEPGRLRIALSFKPTAVVKVHPRVREAVERVADTLRSLGHDVREHEPDYPQTEPLFLPRWLHGIHQDASAMAHPDRLERRNRQLSRIGKLLGEGAVRRARAGEEAAARRINAVFADHDVLLTPTIPAPPDRLARFNGRSLGLTVMGAANVVAFTTPWNLTGQPAASIPAPTADGVPIGAQLVGRPNDESTLLSLSAQLERELDWPRLRPPLD